VHLLTTSAPPQLMLGTGVEDDTILASMYGQDDVPEDDYRAIRRAVLDLPAALGRLER